jgi:hypothetical protein
MCVSVFVLHDVKDKRDMITSFYVPLAYQTAFNLIEQACLSHS